MKKISLIIMFLLIFTGTTYSENIDSYNIYEKRLKDICSKYQYKTSANGKISNEKIEIVKKEKIIKKYSQTGSLDDAKNIYRSNMDNIYECAKITSEIKAYQLNLILIKNNPYLENKLENITKTKINDLKHFQTQNCIEMKGVNTTIKNQILRITTYEICKYNAYLEYFRTTHKNLQKSIDRINNEKKADGAVETTKRYDIKKIAETEQKQMQEIDDEISKIYKAFPVAFKAYLEYENYISIHVLLKVIKTDYIVYRENLHKAINPINQVVYKIANATIK